MTVLRDVVLTNPVLSDLIVRHLEVIYVSSPVTFGPFEGVDKELISVFATRGLLGVA